MKHIFLLLIEAKKGNQEAATELIFSFEPLINKLSKREGVVDEDCKQHLIIEFLLAIRRFDLNRYM